MRLASVEESRRIDRLATTEFAVPSEILMEAAGSQAAREIGQSFVFELRRGRVSIVCGPGNNGADGLVVARHLSSLGCRGVVIVIAAPDEKRSELFRIQLNRCVLQNIFVVDWLSEPSRAKQEIDQSTLIIDALFGIGLKAEVRDPFKAVIEAINSSASLVASLDTPSGLDADRGVALGAAVRADQTLTFGLAKPGFFVSDGPSHVGRLHILPIGFPRELMKREATTRSGFNEAMARSCLPKRKASSNKTTHGHAALFAGRPGMWGAAVLAASSAFRIGAGYVTLSSNDTAGLNEVLTQMPEILHGHAETEEFWKNRKWKVAGIGPGLGIGEETRSLLRKLIDTGVESVVVDADALTVIGQSKVRDLPRSWILTPHAGELSRLIDADSRAIESDRFAKAHEASERYGCIVLLKGYRTVLAHEGRVSVIMSGNAALAKAGTGDVLTGFITGLLAQGLSPVKAAATGAYLHGRLADEWVRSGRSSASLQASDLREVVPDLIARLSKVGR